MKTFADAKKEAQSDQPLLVRVLVRAGDRLRGIAEDARLFHEQVGRTSGNKAAAYFPAFAPYLIGGAGGALATAIFFGKPVSAEPGEKSPVTTLVNSIVFPSTLTKEIREGEIAFSGSNLRSDGKNLVFRANAFFLKNGNSKEIDKERAGVIGSKTEILLDGDPSALTNIPQDANLVAIGVDPTKTGNNEFVVRRLLARSPNGLLNGLLARNSNGAKIHEIAPPTVVQQPSSNIRQGITPTEAGILPYFPTKIATLPWVDRPLPIVLPRDILAEREWLKRLYVPGFYNMDITPDSEVVRDTKNRVYRKGHADFEVDLTTPEAMAYYLHLSNPRLYGKVVALGAVLANGIPDIRILNGMQVDSDKAGQPRSIPSEFIRKCLITDKSFYIEPCDGVEGLLKMARKISVDFTSVNLTGEAFTRISSPLLPPVDFTKIPPPTVPLDYGILKGMWKGNNMRDTAKVPVPFLLTSQQIDRMSTGERAREIISKLDEATAVEGNPEPGKIGRDCDWLTAALAESMIRAGLPALRFAGVSSASGQGHAVVASTIYDQEESKWQNFSADVVFQNKNFNAAKSIDAANARYVFLGNVTPTSPGRIEYGGKKIVLDKEPFDFFMVRATDIPRVLEVEMIDTDFQKVRVTERK